jgi:CRISPR-associated protein Csy2
MSAPLDVRHLLVLPRLRVQNANAISSPLTHGFPAITAFTGLMWALERKARARGLDVRFQGVGVVCHSHQELSTEDGFVRSFRLTRNPVGKDGSTSAIVEEGRIHLNISLVLAVQSPTWSDDPERAADDVTQLAELMHTLRVAGGSVLPSPAAGRRRTKPFAVHLTGTAEQQNQNLRQLRSSLLPGFALVARDDLLEQRWQTLKEDEPQATKLDAWLSLARLNWRYHPPTENTEEARKKAWQHDRKGLGWIVPIPVGYGALDDLHPAGTVANARDASTPFRFVESVYSVGQWVSPHRLQEAAQLLWFPDHQAQTGLYRCRNHYLPPADLAEETFDFT